MGQRLAPGGAPYHRVSLGRIPTGPCLWIHELTGFAPPEAWCLVGCFCSLNCGNISPKSVQTQAPCSSPTLCAMLCPKVVCVLGQQCVNVAQRANITKEPQRQPSAAAPAPSPATDAGHQRWSLSAGQWLQVCAPHASSAEHTKPAEQLLLFPPPQPWGAAHGCSKAGG